MRPLVRQVNRLIAKVADTVEKKQRADTMIKYNPLAIAILKKDRAIVNVNKKYESLWRGTREELMRKRLYDFDITVLSGEHFYACFETKKLAVSECRVKWPDGTLKYLTLQAMPMLDKAGEVDGAFYFWVDTTDLHDKIAESEKVKQRADRIIEENPYALFTIDTGLSVRSANSAFLKLTGYSRDQAAHLSMKDFKYKKNKGASVEATIASKQRGHGESVIEFPPEHSRWTGIISRFSMKPGRSKACSSFTTISPNGAGRSRKLKNSWKIPRRQLRHFPRAQVCLRPAFRGWLTGI